MPASVRRQRRYDHRLKDIVRSTRDRGVASRLGIPRSTVDGWLGSEPEPVVSLDAVNLLHTELHAKLIRLEQQLEVLRAVLKLLLVLVRVMGARLNRRRLTNETKKRVVLHAIRGASSTIPLRAALKIIGLSSARFFSWSSADRPCELEHTASCPRRHPNGLTAAELAAMREMATSEDFKHVPTSRLAILAQRIGRVFASPST